MYDLNWLRRVARDGLADLVPSVRRVLTGQEDHRLDLVFGAAPLRNLLVLAVFGVLAGELLGLLTPSIDLDGIVDPAAAILGAMQAALIRRYLFRTEHATPADFAWLAASVVPAAVLLSAAELLRGTVDLVGELGGVGLLETTDAVVRLLAHVLAIGAAYTVAMATLCYRRNWLRALWDLFLRLLLFQITVYVMVLLLVEIGIVGPIVSAMIGAISGWYPPQWLGDIADIVTYSLLMGVVLLAVIGATWTVCRDNFATLLERGEVDVLESLKAMSESPQARARREAREEGKREKRQQRASRKRGKGQDDSTHA